MNIIFDFDGTLTNNLPVAVKAMNSILKKLNYPLLTEQKIRKLGTKALFKQYKINGAKLLLFVFLARRQIAKYVDEYPIPTNMDKVIEKLSKRNNLAIVTSNSEKNVKKFLRRHHLQEYFNEIYSGSYFGKERKILKIIQNHNWKKSETVYVGDEVRDMEAGKKAGLKTYGVAWGFELPKLLQKAGATKIFKNPHDLTTLVQ